MVSHVFSDEVLKKIKSSAETFVQEREKRIQTQLIERNFKNGIRKQLSSKLSAEHRLDYNCHLSVLRRMKALNVSRNILDKTA